MNIPTPLSMEDPLGQVAMQAAIDLEHKLEIEANHPADVVFGRIYEQGLALSELVKEVFLAIQAKRDWLSHELSPDLPTEHAEMWESKLNWLSSDMDDATPDRWLMIGTQHLQEGLSALRRALKQPTGF